MRGPGPPLNKLNPPFHCRTPTADNSILPAVPGAATASQITSQNRSAATAAVSPEAKAKAASLQNFIQSLHHQKMGKKGSLIIPQVVEQPPSLQTNSVVHLAPVSGTANSRVTVGQQQQPPQQQISNVPSSVISRKKSRKPKAPPTPS